MPSIRSSCCESVAASDPQSPSHGPHQAPRQGGQERAHEESNGGLGWVPTSGSDLPPCQHPGLHYDLVVQQLIPGYASLARLAVALLSVSPRAGRQGAAVLVAGCGTGAELVEARSQRPDWRITAIDPSAAMLTAARERLGDADAEPIHWQQTRVEELQAGGCFAGALSVLVLQSLADDGTKLRFLTALARSLEPGGQLVLVDRMAAERSALQSQVDQALLAFQRASGLTDADGPLEDLTEATHPIGRSRLTALVNAAGFGDPAPIFQALGYEGFLLQRQA
jgi:tRNA (cmo5U34)-methyltransferase